MVKFLWMLHISENTIYLWNMPQTIIIHFDSVDHKVLFAQEEARPAKNQNQIYK